MSTKTGAPTLPGGLTPLLSQRELEAYFGVSRWSVDRWVKAGCPIRRTPTGQKRFDLAAVEAWMDAWMAEQSAA